MAVSNSPTNLGSLLSSVLQQKDWQRRLGLHQVFLFWNEVVGIEIAKHAEPQVIKGDTLWLAVSDSIWMQQLQFERHHILELINERLAMLNSRPCSATESESAPPTRLSDIKFTLDSSFARRHQQAKPKKVAAQPIDHNQFTQFAASLNSIEDHETRESMKRLWLVMHQRPKP
ncbi:MAG: DUF721 domain-containing protein [Desulfobulbaceae bacterium]|nr:DUF721 domain-containing protein [Desulfobulbaceae bacterium]